MSTNTTLVKCLVWDLDNTLWSGTILEGDDVRVADAVRDVVTGLDARGIMQSVSSKNDPDLALARLTELGLAEYFVLPQIGWGRKSDAVRRVADRLRFALGTMAFVDDQPAERAEVSHHLPEVRCYAAEDVLSLLDRPEFSPGTVTVDSARRRQMYQASFRREAEQSSFQGPDEEFLRSLDLVMEIRRATGEELTRVEELTLRTSQMNATGIHYGDAELRGLLSDPAHEVLTVTLTDRFGPHGAIGVLLVERHASVWHLKLLATSCRVVSFGAGAAIINWLVGEAARAGVHLLADFRRTERNRMMEVAYRFSGFDDSACGCRAGLAEPPQPEIERLHLVPAPQPAPATLTLRAPELAAAAGAAG
ncbi:HAD-IIIC family phosphatase [Streptomyces sp. NPDC091294]|uniref:HAD-IIIC family phosphatase n=1 Tax=Streptomyces sp. NPDC091294 TaxID=3365992 RepID=UPI00380686FD